MKKLYKFHWDAGAMGDVEAIFIATEEKVKATIGKQIYFGEILGKHYEIFGPLEESDLKVITDDQDFIEKFEKYVGTSFGNNPLNNLQEDTN